MKIKDFTDNSILLAINASYERVIKKLNQELKEYNCHFTQALILISISLEKEKEARPSLLAKNLKTSKSNISHALKGLEKEKYIKRKLSDKDYRSYVISLAPKGSKIINDLIKIIDRFEISFEQRVGKKLTKTITNNINSFNP